MKRKYKYMGKVYNNIRELGQALGIEYKEARTAVAAGVYKSRCIEQILTTEKIDKKNFRYHGETYHGLNGLAKAYALSPSAVEYLEKNDITAEVIFDVIEEDRKTWKKKDLFINEEYQGTVGEYTRSLKGTYIDLMQSYFGYNGEAVDEIVIQ